MKNPQPLRQVVLTVPTLETEEGRHLFRGKEVQEINELKRDGLSIQAISELTGYDRKTIRKYLWPRRVGLYIG